MNLGNNNEHSLIKSCEKSGCYGKKSELRVTSYELKA